MMRLSGPRQARMNEVSGRNGVLAGNMPAAWTFFRQWLKNPLAMASLSPSGRQLTQAMIAQLPARAQRVVELGAGTGVFTQALVEYGIAPRDLLVVELNDELHRLLQRRFPGVSIAHGDACNLLEIMQRSGFAHPACVDAVVSGLGFLAMPRGVQRAILEQVFAALVPGRPLIQFTYGPKNPLPRELLDDLGLGVRRAGLAWRNVPPAVVYVYTRSRSRPLPGAARANAA